MKFHVFYSCKSRGRIFVDSLSKFAFTFLTMSAASAYNVDTVYQWHRLFSLEIFEEEPSSLSRPTSEYKSVFEKIQSRDKYVETFSFKITLGKRVQLYTLYNFHSQSNSNSNIDIFHPKTLLQSAHKHFIKYYTRFRRKFSKARHRTIP